MMNNKITIKQELLDGIQELYENEFILVSLVTTDGFIIKTHASDEMSTEEDKLAAMSSTICALSNSSTKEILLDQFAITIIETNSGNLLFVRTNYLGFPCVLMTATWTKKMTLANARYKTKALAQNINNISE